MNKESIQKITYIVNTSIVVFLIGISVFFRLAKMPLLEYVSIGLIPVYVINYYLIKKDKLSFYVREVYTLITLYMALCSICTGFQCGFQLYSVSMVLIIFVTDYIAFKTDSKRVKPVLVSACVVSLYVFTILYTAFVGTVYNVEANFSIVCLMANSAIVFFFIILYASYLVKMNIYYETRLEFMAHSDKLTGLRNRHFFMEYLNSLDEEKLENSWIAMLDIDNFKSINDTYGHMCGDDVLVWISSQLQSVCSDCEICRWGGEEFVILSVGGSQEYTLLEELRSKIANTRFESSGISLNLSVTIGVSMYKSGSKMLSWIQEADNLMYEGKKQFKNTVIYDESFV